MSLLVRLLTRTRLLRGDLDYHLVRASMVIIYFFFGYQKWFDYEAQELIPFFTHGPLIFWMYPVFGIKGSTYFLGVSEWLFGALLLAGFWNKKLGALGALGSVATFLCTVTIIPFMPEGWAKSAGGFPAMVGNVAFLMKDLVLLAASVYLLKQDLIGAMRADESARDEDYAHLAPVDVVERSKSRNAAMKLLTTVLLTVATAFAQSPDRLPVTDAEKIADALRAGPAFITRDATVVYWPSKPEGEYRVLRKGSNEWTCLPAIAGYPHDAIDSAFKTEPGCYDPIFLRWMQDSLVGRTPHIDRIGISYMYLGLWKWAKGGSGHDFHVGPHLMIVSPNQDEFQGFNRDATNGMPYVTHLPNRAELFLVMPIRQWDEQ